MNWTGLSLNLGEMAMMLFLAYFAPSGLVKAVAFAAPNFRFSGMGKFIGGEFRSALVGMAIAACFFAVAGKNQDELIVQFVRESAMKTLTVFGLDPASACMARVDAQYKFTADGFNSELEEFNIYGSSTYSEREQILAIAALTALSGRNNPETLYIDAARQYCSGSNPARRS